MVTLNDLGSRAAVSDGINWLCCMCQIGTGFSDSDLEQHSCFLREHVIAKAKPYYRFDTQHEPDVWFDAVQVWEVKAADLSISPTHCAAAGLVRTHHTHTWFSFVMMSVCFSCINCC